MKKRFGKMKDQGEKANSLTNINANEYINSS